jgi:hypothetical protein
MSRRTRWLSAILLVAAIVAAIVGIYFALRHEPAFYREALETKRDVLEKGSDRMLKQIGALQGAMVRSGRWQADITADEINGWLAVDLRKNHPNALPPSVHDPRVVIEPNEIDIGCQFDHWGGRTVLSLAFQPYVPEPNIVAFRIIRGRAGALPAPLKDVLDGISRAAAQLRLRMRWAQSGGDPVALISMPDDDADCVVHIESIELRKGVIRITGVTERRKR